MCIYVEHCKNVGDMCALLWRLEAALGLTIVDKRYGYHHKSCGVRDKTIVNVRDA